MILALWTGFVKRDVICCLALGAGGSKNKWPWRVLVHFRGHLFFVTGEADFFCSADVISTLALFQYSLSTLCI